MEGRVGAGGLTMVNNGNRLEDVVIEYQVVVPHKNGEVIVPAIGEDFDLADGVVVSLRHIPVAVDAEELFVGSGEIVQFEQVINRGQLRSGDCAGHIGGIDGYSGDAVGDHVLVFAAGYYKNQQYREE